MQRIIDMNPTIADYIDVNGGKIYYEMAGDGDVLVLVHAGFVDSRMWNGQWADFARHYRVIRYDMRGYGKSSPLTEPVSPREDLLALMNHLDVQRAHVVGCSAGGEIVLDFTLEYPNRVQSLVVVSAVPSGFAMQGEMPKEIPEMMHEAQAGNLERVSDLQVRLWVDGPYRHPDQVDSAVRELAAEMNRIPVMSGTWGMMSQPVNPLNPPAAQRLETIHVPTLIIAGALDNAEIVRIAGVMEASIQNAQKHIIEGAAHVPNMEKPAEFNQTVLDFLSAVK